MMKLIKPSGPAIDVAAVEKAVQNALNACAQGAKVDFNTTTRTWKNRPEFQIDASQPDRRTITTDDNVYRMVNEGTQPHIIRPRRARVLSWIGTAYRAKTAVGVIGSRAGGNDNTIVHTRMVQHPGTQARKFDIAIRDKWAGEMQTRMQAALIAAVTK